MNNEKAITKQMIAAYDRSKLHPKILHIGLGAFFRAHLADYTDIANRVGDGTWGIRAVKTRPGGDVLTGEINNNGGVYSLVETSANGANTKIIGALYDTVFYAEQPERVFEVFEQPDFAVVTTTITEKGYCFDFGRRQLDKNNPDILHDITHFSHPKSAIGIVVRGLWLRKCSGLGGITLLSCDNMTNNGHTFQKAVVDFAQLIDEQLAAWIVNNVSFPCAMVDRIVPAMNESSLEIATQISGFSDKAAIMCEQFKQWVVEDDFRNGRPDWESAGAIFAPRVEPFEEMKLRLLNGSHSMLAYCGYLGGYETVDQAIADPSLRKMLKSYWLNEAIPTLEQPQGITFAEYCGRLLNRYENPALKHRLWQIAMDGSQKLPYRLLGGLRTNIHARRACPATVLAIAAWLRYISGVDDAGRAIDVHDPLAAELRQVYETAADGVAYVKAVLAIERVFGTDLAGDEDFAGQVCERYLEMKKNGVKHTLEKYYG